MYLYHAGNFILVAQTFGSLSLYFHLGLINRSILLRTMQLKYNQPILKNKSPTIEGNWLVKRVVALETKSIGRNLIV